MLIISNATGVPFSRALTFSLHVPKYVLVQYKPLYRSEGKAAYLSAFGIESSNVSTRLLNNSVTAAGLLLDSRE